MAINKHCLVCGKHFTVRNSRKDTAKYCSVECKNIGIMKTDEEKYVSTTILICGQCNEKFEVESWRVGIARYCSRECMGDSKKKDKLKTCEQCGEEFTYKKREQRFCSRECFGEHRKLKPKKCKYCGEIFQPYKSGEKNPMYKGMSKFICEWCDSGYEDYPSRKHRTRFCSEECRRDWLKNTLRGENSHLWRGGTIDSRGENWLKQRAKALSKDSYKCIDCSLTNEESLKRYNMELSVHHLIPFRQFRGDYITANKLDNLVTVCVSCHHVREHELYKQYDNPEPSLSEMTGRCRD